MKFQQCRKTAFTQTRMYFFSAGNIELNVYLANHHQQDSHTGTPDHGEWPANLGASGSITLRPG
jgi:hypothetical protein